MIESSSKAEKGRGQIKTLRSPNDTGDMLLPASMRKRLTSGKTAGQSLRKFAPTAAGTSPQLIRDGTAFGTGLLS